MRVACVTPLVALLVACAAGAPPPPQSPPAPAAPATTPPPAASPARATLTARQLAGDTPITSASGATFTAPMGWWVTEGPDAIVLEDPDRAIRATFLETLEPDPITALDAAWQRLQPGFARHHGDPDSPPGVRGWDAISYVGYETKEAEHRQVSATARRYGATTYLTLVDGDARAFGVREPQLQAAIWSVRPKGMHPESFKDQTPHPLDGTRATDLDMFIEDARVKLDVPGAAVAVIVGDKVAYEKAFGTRTIGKNEPVTSATLFEIGSITKSMTTMMEATLVDAGVLTWDEPVHELLPSFALGDADLTRTLTLWQTSCHCSGIPEDQALDWFRYPKPTAEGRLSEMKTLRPNAGMGERFQYSNQMVAAGGYAAAHAFAPKRALNDAFVAVMKKKLFEPIGMTSSSFYSTATPRANYASPHAESIDGVAHEVPSVDGALLALLPAGGVWSNLHDMERYVLTEMADGVSPDGKRVVSAANLHERRKMRVKSGDDGGYGLGLNVTTFRDLTTLSHAGGTWGFGTMMEIFLEPKIGIVVLTNTAMGSGANSFGLAVWRKVFEELFESARDVAGARLAYFVKQKRDSLAQMADVNREPDPSWVKALAGVYTNPELGKITISPAAKGGVLDAGEWKSTIGKGTADGANTVVLVDPPLAGLAFIVGGDAAHPTLRTGGEAGKHVFERVR